MQPRLLLLLAALSCLVAPAHAQYTSPDSKSAPKTGPPASASATTQAVCPWLTQGTAAKLLGGDVSVTAKVSEDGEGLCGFTRLESARGTLEIAVSKAALAGCPAHSVDMAAIGNEAQMCTHPGVHNDLVQRISSRVRDQHFTVTITAPGSEKAMKAVETRDEPIYRVAEQVAGSLF